MNRRFDKIKDISVIGSGDIIGSAISAGFWFYLASIIDVDSYGEINYFISIAQTASAIALLGMTNTLVVYSAKNVKIHATLYLLSLSIGTISAVVVYFLVDNFETTILVMGYIVFAIAYSDLLGRKKFKTYRKFIIIQKCLMVGLALIFYLVLGENGVILGIGSALLIGIGRTVIGFKETEIDFKLLREKSRFFFSNYMHTLVGSFSGTIDKIIIGSLFGFTILGNYSLGMQFLALVGILPGIVSRYLIPQDATGIENKKLKKYIIIISFFIGILGFVIGPEVITQIFPKYTDVDVLIRIFSLTIIPATITLTYQSKFLGNERGHYLLYTVLLKLSILIFGIVVLGEFYDIIGIGVSLVVATISEVILSIYLAKKLEYELSDN